MRVCVLLTEHHSTLQRCEQQKPQECTARAADHTLCAGSTYAVAAAVMIAVVVTAMVIVLLVNS
jgi:hypothetical protein